MIKLDRANCLAYDGDVTGTVAVVMEATTPLTDQQRHGIIASRVRGIIAILPPQHRALPTVSVICMTSCHHNPREKIGHIVIEISPATHGNVEAIALLMDDLDRFYGATDVEPPRERVTQIAAALFEDPRAAYALLAWQGEQLVGMAAYSFLWPAAGVTRSLYLKEIYVTESPGARALAWH